MRALVVPLLWAAAFAIAGFLLSSGYLGMWGLGSAGSMVTALVGKPEGFAAEMLQAHQRAGLGFVGGATFLFALIGLAIGRADARR